MPNTSNQQKQITWLNQQESLIVSLRLQPLVVVLRPVIKDLENPCLNNSLFALIYKLTSQGIKHIEVAWSPHPRWLTLMHEVRKTFPYIYLGAASIKDTKALQALIGLGLNYAMSPFWDLELQKQAKELKQVLIPGVFSPTEIREATSFGCRLIKIFPASILGIKYLHQISPSLGYLPFVIAAGGLTAKDIKPWLNEGYDALAIGRELMKGGELDPALLSWLVTHK